MAHPLGARVTPRALAESRQVIDFEGKLSAFEGLAGIVEADLQRLAAADRPGRWRASTVTVTLRFGFADRQETVPAVTGTAAVSLAAVCQRCMEAFELPLEVAFDYVLLRASEKTPGYAEHEVWELESDDLTPLELVQETLIMALPLSAMHESIELCGPLAERLDPARPKSAATTRPFAGLKEQLEGKT